MRFISSLCWVKQGISKTPSRLKLEKNEMKKIFSDLNRKKRPTPNKDSNDEANQKNDDDDEEDTDKKYNLDDYDNEGNFRINKQVCLVVNFFIY